MKDRTFRNSLSIPSSGLIKTGIIILVFIKPENGIERISRNVAFFYDITPRHNLQELHQFHRDNSLISHNRVLL
jgi:hypothetical protein